MSGVSDMAAAFSVYPYLIPTQDGPTGEIQHWEWHDKRHMPPPPNLQGATETVDDTSHRQHRTKPETSAEDTRGLLQTIQEQVVLAVDVDTALTGMELEGEHWQQKEAAAAHRYTRALGLPAQIAEEVVGQFHDGNHPDKQCLLAVDEAHMTRQDVDS
jgi:hypothetical protein